ncbi:MAG: helix-turn-helix transcriptional regulator, partial [Promethearchaeota archaeon]
MKKAKNIHLGWLQQTILTMLVDREMYGLEIQRTFKFFGEKVGPGQLYPALTKLERLGAIKVREEERVGANRKFYTTTDEGKIILLRNSIGYLAIMESMAMEKFAFIFDELPKLVKIKLGTIILDFSHAYLEQIYSKLAPLTAPTGRYFIISRNKLATKIIKDRLNYKGLQDLISIFELQENKINLPDKSVDVCIVCFTLHEDGTDWIISEINRLLKKHGKGIIIDMTSLKGHVVEEIMTSMIPNHSRVGIDKDILFPLLKKYNLDISYQKEEKGTIILLIEP